jgi:hypothetical protein
VVQKRRQRSQKTIGHIGPQLGKPDSGGKEVHEISGNPAISELPGVTSLNEDRYLES